MRIAIALVVLSAIAHADASRDAIERARELEAKLAYDEALTIIESAIAAGQSERERLVDLHFIAGRLSAGLDRTKLAEDHFAVVLALDPQRTLPDDTSPKIAVPFTVARTRSQPLVVKLVVEAESIEVQPIADALKLVAGIAVRTGAETSSERTKLRVTRPSQPIVDVRALDRHGNVVWIGVPPAEKPIETRPIVVDDRNLLQRWPTWAIATGVALATGGLAAWRNDVAQNEFDDKLADGASVSELESIEARGKRWALVANISFIAAGAFGVTTIATLVLFPAPAQQQRDVVGIGVGGTF